MREIAQVIDFESIFDESLVLCSDRKIKFVFLMLVASVRIAGSGAKPGSHLPLRRPSSVRDEGAPSEREGLAAVDGWNGPQGRVPTNSAYSPTR